MAKKSMKYKTALAAVLARLSEKERKAVDYVVENKTPVLFVGKSGAGKTTLAKALREMGIAAYAPEDIAVIQLGAKKNELKQLKNDNGFPVLIESVKLVRLV